MPLRLRLPRPLHRLLMGSTLSGPGPGAAAATSPSPTLSTPLPPNTKPAYFAAGCFWGVESAFKRHFGARIASYRVGYMGGATRAPSYRAVCGGATGHAEALRVDYVPDDVRYEELLEFFFRMHDPTTVDRQGPDVGSQYRSVVFVGDEGEEKVAREVRRRVDERWYEGKVKTEVVRPGEWWDAEEYHQRYLERNPGGYECPSHYVRKFPTVLDTPIEV